MRTIERTTRFKRDYKREAKGRHRATLAFDLVAVLELLAVDAPLDTKYRDHALAGDWADHRDCHIRPDLVLIYLKAGEDALRLGSHSELGLRTSSPLSPRACPVAACLDCDGGQ